MRETSRRISSYLVLTLISTIVIAACGTPSSQSESEEASLPGKLTESETLAGTPDKKPPVVEAEANNSGHETQPSTAGTKPEKGPDAASPHADAGVDSNGMMDSELYRLVRSLAARWNRTKGRDKDGAHAGASLKLVGEKYYNVFLLSLKHPNASYRVLASLTLALTGRKEIQEKIVEAFKSEEDKAVRSDYLLSLAVVADSDFPVDMIQAIIEDKDPVYASRASYLLFFILEREKDASFAKKFSKIGGGELLIEQLSREDEKGFARRNAVLALGFYPARKAIGALIDMILTNRKDKQLEALVSRTLEKMTGQKLTTAEQWKNWRDENLPYLKWNPETAAFEVDTDARQKGEPIVPSSEEYK